MTIQDFIPIWQGQPFRAFRLHTARGQFVVNYPAGAALTSDMRVAVVVDAHVETFGLDEIERCEAFGQPMSLADVMAAIPPETLAAHMQLLSAAQTSTEPETAVQPAQVSDSGIVALVGSHAEDGVHVVHATVQTRDGRPMLSTAGTRWNVHGTERFENGSSLYLHHLDHPTVEQRIILWPPDQGTFKSFGEAMSTAALANELHRRDQELAKNPEKPIAPPASYFRKIVVERKLAEPDLWAEMFGEENPAIDPASYEFLFVPRTSEGGRKVENLCLTDTKTGEVVIELLDTDWDATCTPEDRTWHLSLSHAASPGNETTLHIDFERRGATIDSNELLLPLSWIERHLRNFAVYKLWDLMYRALVAGPVSLKQPDVIVPLAGGFNAELWAGEPRFPTPFLQPHIVDNAGRTVFDLRATTWSASIRADKNRPAVTLVFSSGEQEARESTHPYPLELDLITHRVKCPALEGSTTIGMMQAMVRRVSGVKWMLEEIPKWFAKGRSLPDAS